MRLAKSQPMLRSEERARLEEIKEIFENVELSGAEMTALRLEYQHRLEAEEETVREPGQEDHVEDGFSFDSAKRHIHNTFLRNVINSNSLVLASLYSLPIDALRRIHDLPELVKTSYAFGYGGDTRFMGIGYKTNGEHDIEGDIVFEDMNHVLASSSNTRGHCSAFNESVSYHLRTKGQTGSRNQDFVGSSAQRSRRRNTRFQRI